MLFWNEGTDASEDQLRAEAAAAAQSPDRLPAPGNQPEAARKSSSEQEGNSKTQVSPRASPALCAQREKKGGMRGLDLE